MACRFLIIKEAHILRRLVFKTINYKTLTSPTLLTISSACDDRSHTVFRSHLCFIIKIQCERGNPATLRRVAEEAIISLLFGENLVQILRLSFEVRLGNKGLTS